MLSVSLSYWSVRDIVRYLADHLGLAISASTVSRWSQSGPWGFPRPNQISAASPLWLAEEVKSWAEIYARVKALSGPRLSHLVRTYAQAGRAFRPQAKAAVLEDKETSRSLAPVGPTISKAIEVLVAAYRNHQQVWKEEFDALVSRSTALLGCEPLLLPSIADSAVLEDENAVSDVLATVLRLLPKSAAFEMFGLSMHASSDELPRHVEREWPVAHGHTGRCGRLDVAAIFSDSWLVIETKLDHADKADLAKNQGYIRSLQKSGIKYEAVAIVTDISPGSHGHGFSLVVWRDVLLRLRRVIANRRHQFATHAAIALVFFTGMLERRVLGMRLDSRAADPLTQTYLNQFHRETQS